MQAKQQILQYKRHVDLTDTFKLIIIFIITRILFFILGIRFQDGPLYGYWQYIDIDLLRNNLIQSIFFLHAQPPLFNIYLGIIAKVFKNNMIWGFDLSFMLAGLMLALSMLRLMRGLGVGKNLSFVLTIIFIISPSAILYENHLIYTYFVAALLITSSFFLYKFLRDNNIWDCFSFFALLTSIILIRPTYQPVWFCFIFIFLFIYKKSCRKQMIYAALPFAILIAAVYLKNYYLFGLLTSSSWAGMFISGSTTFVISDFEREELYDEGIISDVSMIPIFSDLSKYNRKTDGSYIEEQKWIGIDADKVGKGDTVMPDGIKDGHYRLIINISGVRPVKISSIEILDSNGGIWSSSNNGCWILGVFYKDLRLNSDYSSDLGNYSGRVELDLYGSELGSEKRIGKYMVRISLNNGEEYVQMGYTNKSGCTNCANSQIDKKHYIPIIYNNTGIPVLDQESKSIGGPNFNNIAIINISKIYASDGMQVVLNRPKSFLKAYQNAIIRSSKLFFYPSSDYFKYFDTFSKNPDRIRILNEFYNTIFYGKLPSGVGVFLVIGYLVVLIYGIKSIFAIITKKSLDLSFDMTIAIMTIDIIYVILTCILLNPAAFDQFRYRFEVDPLAFVILGVILNGLKEKIDEIRTIRGQTKP